MSSVRFTISIFFVVCLVFAEASWACKVTPDHSANWKMKQLAEKSHWIVEGEVSEEVRKDGDVQYVVTPKNIFKGKKESSYRTEFYRYAGNEETLPMLDMGCHFSVKLKTGKNYIFFAFAENKLSVMEANKVNRSLIKKTIRKTN